MVESKRIHPIDLLNQVSSSEKNSHLKVSNGTVIYHFYFNQGQLFYATNSVDNFERLERHLRRLSHEVKTVTSEVRTQVRLNFEREFQEDNHPSADVYVTKPFTKEEIIRAVKSVVG